MMGENIVRNM